MSDEIERVHIQVMSVLTPKSIVGCVAGSGVYRFEFKKKIQNLNLVQKSTPVSPSEAYVQSMQWDLRKGVYLCTELLVPTTTSILPQSLL